MASPPRRHRYCRCGTPLARDNTGRQCSRCEHTSRDKLLVPPIVAPGFWHTEAFREAFTARHMGRISRVYRAHPDHRAVYGADGISQTLLGQWIGLSQPQISRFETGPPLQQLDTLQHWARTLRIPPHLLWFRLPGEDTYEPVPSLPAHVESADDPERDPVLVAPWSHRGTVEAVGVLSGGGRMRRRVFLSLTGPALTGPAHQWLVHEPEPLIAGLSGRRISAGLADRLTGMTAELRRMDDVAGGGSVLALAQQQYGWVTGLLDRASYDDSTGRKLHTALAELGQFCGWAAFDSGNHGLAQRYYIAALRAAHTADDRAFGAYILSGMAHQATHSGQPAEAVTLVETALAGSRRQATPALLTQLYCEQAYAFAALQDRSSCTASVSRTRNQVERLNPGDDPPWLYWMTPALVAVRSGHCFLELNQAAQAAALFRDGVTQFNESLTRDRQVYFTRLADALARPGKQQDLDAAAGLGMQSIDLAESLDSARGAGLLRDLCHRMTPHAEVPAVRDFLDRARATSP